MATQADLYELITPIVSEAVHNQNIIDALARHEEALRRNLDARFKEGFLSPGVRPSDERRLRNYLMKIMQAYPDDEAGRLNELYMLLDTNYLKGYKLGLLPAPLSRPWSVFIRAPYLFNMAQVDMRNLYRRFVRQLD